MTCVRCEVIRSRIVGKSFALFGLTNDEIAVKLKALHGAEYYATSQGVYRANSVPPFMPYRIIERPQDG